MQNQYVGDVGDFGKVGLLRALTGVYPAATPPLKLGVVWYLTLEVGIDSTCRPENNVSISAKNTDRS